MRMSLTGCIKYDKIFSNDILKLPYSYKNGFKNSSNGYMKKVSWSNPVTNLFEEKEKGNKFAETKFFALTGLTGTMFDYLARIFIARYINDGEIKFFKHFVPNDWIEHFLENFKDETPNDCEYVKNIYDKYIDTVKLFIMVNS